MPSVRPQIQIGNEVRAMNDVEFEQYQKDQIDFADIAKRDAELFAKKMLVIEKLGLTADEIAALLS